MNSIYSFILNGKNFVKKYLLSYIYIIVLNQKAISDISKSHGWSTRSMMKYIFLEYWEVFILHTEINQILVMLIALNWKFINMKEAVTSSHFDAYLCPRRHIQSVMSTIDEPIAIRTSII